MVEMDVRTAEQQNSIKLIKGQKDSYGWEIKVYGGNMESMLKTIDTTNSALKINYKPQ